MSDARSAILGRIERALRNDRDPPSSGRSVDQAPMHPRPDLGEGALLGLFVERLRASGASAVSAAADQAGVAVSEYLRESGLALDDVPTAPDPLLDQLPWPDDLVRVHRAPQPTEPAALTGAFAGIAETGSLVLASGPTHPTLLNFLPDHHVVVLDCTRIVSHMEDVWALWRQQRGPMPRALNVVTGPSRTADIEQTIQLGAHGPRRLHVVLINVDEAPVSSG